MIIHAVIAVVVCVIGAGISSGLEIAFVSLDRLKLHHLVEKKNPRALIINRMIRDMERLLATTLIATNIFLVSGASVAQLVAIRLIPGVSREIRTLITSLVMTSVFLIFSEIIPKALFRRYSDTLPLKFARPISLAIRLFRPFVSAITSITSVLIGLTGINRGAGNPYVTLEELRFLVKLGETNGVIEEAERKIIHSIFDFHGKTVREIMTPRVDVESVEITDDISLVIEKMHKSGHSRLPVYEEHIDSIKGIIYEKDLIYSDLEDKCVKDFMREPTFIPESKCIDKLFSEMQNSKLHQVIVVDEHGGFSGIVTIEDILEELVGEIQDEYDNENTMHKYIGDNTWILDAMMNVEVVNRHLGLSIPEDDCYDTIGGYVFNVLGHIPRENEIITLKDMRLVICKADSHRIYSVKLTLKKADNEGFEKPEEKKGAHGQFQPKTGS